MLLYLPTELLRLVLQTCDPSAYLQLAFSCRTLLEIASNSRDLLVAQLSQTPGPAREVDGLVNRQLFGLLMKLSYRQLFGAEIHSEFKLFNLSDNVVDSRASTLEIADPNGQFLLVFKNHSTVYMCSIQDSALHIQHRLESPVRHLGQIEILRTTYDSRGVYVLHRFHPHIEDGVDTSHPFVKQALQSNANGNIFLAYYSLHSGPGTIRVYGFQETKDYEPLAFAAHQGKFAISWQHIRNANEYHVTLYIEHEHDEESDDEGSDDEDSDDEDSDDEDGYYTSSARILNCRYDSYVLTEGNQPETEGDGMWHWRPTVKLSFNDRGSQLLHHYKSERLYGSFQRIPRVPPIKPLVVENACTVMFSNSLALGFSIGIPFFYTHQIGDGTPWSRCHWQYLAIGIATHRVQHWTVACLLKSEAFPMTMRCDHALNLERGRRFDDWEIMAQLGGYQEVNTTQGFPIAASPRGTRIAIANWKSVSVWALEPRILLEGRKSFYPESWQLTEGFPELRPVVIQLEAVCSQLRFTDKENELLAITDRGLMLIQLKPDGKGVRVVERQNGWTAE